MHVHVYVLVTDHNIKIFLIVVTVSDTDIESVISNASLYQF